MCEQQAFYNGKPLDYNQLNLWDKFRITMDLILQKKLKLMAKQLLTSNIVDLLLLSLRLMVLAGCCQSDFSKKHNTSVPTPYTFGRDPIPSINLYRNAQKQNSLWLTVVIVFLVQWQNITQNQDN